MTPELEKVMNDELKRNLVSHASSDEVASFVLGFNLAIAHLEKQAGEWNQAEADAEERLCPPTARPYAIWMDGAKRQWAKCKARIGLMRDNLHSREIQINELKDRLAESERSLKLLDLENDGQQKRITTLSQLIRDKGIR